MCGEFFTEEQTENVRFSLRIKRWLSRRITKYQLLEIAETLEVGKLLALDGKVMLTEGDERFYHEMLVHPPMVTHSCPRAVLIIGGGDGGTLREVLKHPTVEKVTLVELDGEVIEECKRWLPEVSQGAFEDERVTIVIENGERFVERCSKEFDVIIVDSTDPVGHAEPLFSESFYLACKVALKESGILCTHCGTPFYFKDEVKKVIGCLRKIFANVRLYIGFVPTYPSGLWAYCISSDGKLDLRLGELEERCAARGLKNCSYYTPKVQEAAFVLPAFIEALIQNA
ncbi:MAG: polyamine aminopropyltransferase [Armatimonadota bacterium]|nr:polyamine aminopropyltransferase [Armatimonadota bacterium]MCX7778011.1 polyamine aminopropyltransferase [Armatimonadota bacterium]MDW8026014.1 polyamine aminopropyltransferase [Armatimonadota bacterium]